MSRAILTRGLSCLQLRLSLPLLVLPLLLQLSGCAGLHAQRTLPDIPLLSPSALANAPQFTQQVVVTLEGKPQSMLAAWVVRDDVLQFVGLTPTGQRLLTLSYNGSEFTEEYSELLPEPIPGRQVLAHLQLAHWPLQVVEAGLAGSGWRVVESSRQRELYYKDKPIFIIRYSDTDTHGKPFMSLAQSWPLSIEIQSDVMPMQLHVTTVQVN